MSTSDKNILDLKYPPEEDINPEIVKRVEAAEMRVTEGKGKEYTPDEFKTKFSLG